VIFSSHGRSTERLLGLEAGEKEGARTAVSRTGRSEARTNHREVSTPSTYTIVYYQHYTGRPYIYFLIPTCHIRCHHRHFHIYFPYYPIHLNGKIASVEWLEALIRLSVSCSFMERLFESLRFLFLLGTYFVTNEMKVRWSIATEK